MSAKVTIGVDNTQLNAGMAAATNTVRKFSTESQSAADKVGDSLKKAFAFAGGVAAVQGLAFAVKGLLNDFDDIADAATKLNISAESFQRIKLAAELSGASVDGLATALLKMEAGLQRGGAEGEKLSKALESLGINITTFTAAKPEEKIAMLSAAFQQARAEGRGLSEIQDLFKKQFTELIPLLSASSQEMAKLSQQKVVSDEDVKRLAAANDALDAFVVSIKVLAGTSLAGLMEQFESINTTLQNLTGKLVGVKEVIGLIVNPAGTVVDIAKDTFDKVTGKKPKAGEAPPPVGLVPQTTTSGTTIPGLEAATGISSGLLDLPGLNAASGPQKAAIDRAQSAKSEAGTASKWDKEQLEALKRNNEILAQLAAY